MGHSEGLFLGQSLRLARVDLSVGPADALHEVRIGQDLQGFLPAPPDPRY